MATDLEDGTSSMAELQPLYEEGKAKFETYDFRGAIEAWTVVYAQLGDTPHERQIKNDLIYNIAMAHRHAFEQDRDKAHLRQAIQLLHSYIDEFKSLHEATEDRQQHIAEVESQIWEITVQTRPVPPPAVVAPPSERSQIRTLLRTDPELSVSYRRGRSMVTAGAILTGVGGTMFILGLSYGDLEPSNSSIRGIVLASLGGSALATGIALLGVGIHTKRKTKRAALDRLVVTPQWGPRLTGVSTSFRF